MAASVAVSGLHPADLPTLRHSLPRPLRCVRRILLRQTVDAQAFNHFPR